MIAGAAGSVACRVEIYAKSSCGFCWRAKQLLDSQGRRVSRRSRSTSAGAEREEMIQRANGRTTVPQIFINGRACRRLRRSLRLDRDGQAGAMIWQPDGQDRALPVDRRASTPPPMPRGWPTPIGAGGRGRRGDAVHAGDVGPARPRLATAPRQAFALEEDDQVLAAVPRRRAREHGIWVHLGSLAVLAEGGKLANRGVRDRPARRDPRALRQDPSVRRRPSDRRELARIATSIGTAAKRWSSTARRSASSA